MCYGKILYKMQNKYIKNRLFFLIMPQVNLHITYTNIISSMRVFCDLGDRGPLP